MHITFVKKVLMNGLPCQKCIDVEKRLETAGHLAAIDEILIADERDPESEGMLLAAEVKVDRAPFFVVTDANGHSKVYTVYFKFAKEVLGSAQSKTDEAKELLNDNPDLDFV